MTFFKRGIHFIAIILLSVSFFSGIGNTTEWEIKVLVQKADIHQEPDIKSSVIATLQRGSILRSYEKVNEWFRMILPDEKGFVVIGYIHSSAVEIIREKPDEEEMEEEEPGLFQGIGLNVMICIGANYFLAKEVNRGTEGIANSSAASAISLGYTVERELEPLHAGYEFSVDFIYDISSKLGIGLGVNYMHWQKTSKLFLIDTSVGWDPGSQLHSSPKISALPIRLGLFFTLPIHRLLNICLNGGAAYYLTNYSYNLLTRYQLYEAVIHRAKASGFGVQGGIAVEINLNTRSALVIEYQGRYARIGNFKGTEEIISGEKRWKEEGTLYYIKGKDYPRLVILERESGGYETLRKAVVDLSGYSLRVGLRMKF